MRAQWAIGILSSAAAAVGAALISYGIATREATPYRAGMALLIIGMAGLLLVHQRRTAARVMAHQARMARLSQAERDRYTRMGWRAAMFDSHNQTGTGAGAGQVVQLPGTRATSAARTKGSAS
ncbi:hypothetical protein [Streptomyces seoulensis]|uniref:hypothetical protein n=1 Tax=Streptomyces seoulensis TaxID=73044 RepID=UPI001FCCA16D|nr:hypothetical protein [Streptomyces seoulensis]BDH04852.1 hypothetical protein HEK131_20790 [Streptomyces seoulensis]